MAVQGAHLTSTTADEGDSPSIFEVLAQESLVQALRPALQHLLRVLAEKNPTRYGRLYVYCDEVYLCLQLVLEKYYLKHYGSSFSENFYGMKRVAVDVVVDDRVTSPSLQCDTNDGQPPPYTLYNSLPSHHRHKSLMFLVLVPYLKNKCDAYYEKLSGTGSGSATQGQTNSVNWKKRVCKAFLGIYPVFHTLWETTMLSFQMAYIFDKSKFHSPFLKWAGVVLHNLTEDDLAGQGKPRPLNLADKGWAERAAVLSNQLLGGLAVTLSTGLSVGVFFLQFLEWWYTSDQKAISLTALPNPPPPKPLREAGVPSLHTLCGICQRVRTNDTALAVSGYVFCYSCISRYISENSCCPVTKYPASSDHLVRLYLPDS